MGKIFSQMDADLHSFDGLAGFPGIFQEADLRPEQTSELPVFIDDGISILDLHFLQVWIDDHGFAVRAGAHPRKGFL